MAIHALYCDGVVLHGDRRCQCGATTRHHVRQRLARVPTMKSRTRDQLTAAITFALVVLVLGLVAAPWVGVLLFVDAPGVALFWTAIAEASVLVVAGAIALANLN